MQLLMIKIKTFLDLGLIECFSVLLYRIFTKLSIHPVCFIKADVPLAPFFQESKLPKLDLPISSAWEDNSNLFSHLERPLANKPPHWLRNPLSTDNEDIKLIPWWKIPDFDYSNGDIKLIWEQSRMNWVVIFAQRVRNGDSYSLSRLNDWISDWSKKNPPYLGPNWKCGQEASIRVINLCCAALILGQEYNSLPSLQELIKLHLRRISPTLHYAIAQNNNHGTSEAAALFIGGSWLTALGSSDGEKYEILGRKWLNNRVTKLIEKDGSFSQYSTNYHRMMLDTLSIAEIWRRKINRDKFSPVFYNKASKATSWLYQMISPDNGNGPNLGANDGSLLIQLTDSEYRDYRPSVQLASCLFNNVRAYPNEGLWDSHLSWLGIINDSEESEEYVNCNFDYGGYKILRYGHAKLIFRFPKFRFRPSQADAMHVDFWIDGDNLLNDAGSYSYNSADNILNYFNGTAGHNTIQFDERDQMPKIGRFLFGNWLKAVNVSSVLKTNSFVKCSASYRDFKGSEHQREIILRDNSFEVVDKVSGFKNKAVIRWRLAGRNWVLKKYKNIVEVSNGKSNLKIDSNVDFAHVNLTEGWTSFFYMKKEKISTLEAEILEPGSLITNFKLEQ